MFKAIVLPPVGPLLLVFVGLALMPGRPRLGRALAWFGSGALLLLSMPIVSEALVALDRPPPPFASADAAGAEAIVILGGGVREEAPEFGGDTLGRLTLERVRYGARIAMLTRLPVLVSGGKPNTRATAEALLMRDALQYEFGVPVRWIEQQSVDTHQNALMSARMLEAEGIRKIVLVAHGVDMRRAAAEFTAAGLTVVPAATHLPSRRASSASDWLPSPSGLQTSYYALYEFFGYVALQLRRIVAPTPAA